MSKYNMRLATALKRKKFSQYDLARHLGYKSTTRISMFFNGHAVPTPEQQEQIAKFVGKPVKYLFGKGAYV